MLGGRAQTPHNNVRVACLLGLRPRCVLTTARGRRKGQPRAPRPPTQAVASSAARPGGAEAPPAVPLGGAAAARSAKDSGSYSSAA
ncbi:hypothetical protein NDU88_012783 [Pleurodeles waltl]|uniref:Uncharacterized protein n=1 Tax=Pleurodeles waltl TaxID=8319 RepID=A0AAV7R2W3_PLEWA|nr:hypothetical protein NDU88_012783 [Pleurodeles waltl]